jgi:NTP pyrophosphatase (non-canonical NTP hydrolase)
MTFGTNERKIMQSALDKYGAKKQSDIAIEEMSELTKAIIKHRRYATAETYENLIEEIADVMIMCEQLAMATEYTEVGFGVRAKIERLKTRLESEAGA